MFSHAFDFAFELVSNRKNATDVTAEMLRAALIRRGRTLTCDELRGARGCFETAEVPDD